MRITDDKLKTILNNIPDFNQKKMIGDLIVGRITKNVKCMSEKCNGRVVAQIYEDGKIRPSIDSGIMWLYAYRHRLDGSLGFQCMCGNDSRLAEVEKGIKGIEENSISREDIETVYTRIETTKPSYKKTGKKLEVNNFIIEDID